MHESASKKCRPLWFKDAIIYELHIRAFFDSNGDGIGDFPGLIQKLDYLEDLGINTIWLLPFYPSPHKDDGFDVMDHCDVHPDYGTLSDFKQFLKEAHRSGLRVITELLLNHTSDQHPWFKKSRKSKAGSCFRELYVWSDTPEKYKEARIMFTDEESTNWTCDPEAKAYYFESNKISIRQMERIMSDLVKWKLNIEDTGKVKRLAGESIFKELKRISAEDENHKRVERLNRLFPLRKKFKLTPNLHKSQNLYFEITINNRVRDGHSEECTKQFILLGDSLGIKVE